MTDTAALWAAVCPGACNRDYRRAETTGKPHNITPAAGEPNWCSACTHRITLAIRDMVTLYAALDADKAARTSAGEKTSGSKAPPSPSPQVDAQDEMTRLLMHWEDSVREARSMTLRRGARAGVRDVNGTPVGLAYRLPERTTLTTTVAFLLGNLPWMLGDAGRDAATQFGRDMLNARRRYEQLTGGGSGQSRRPMPCPRCDHKTLVHHFGTDAVSCEQCGRILTLEEYDELARGVTTGRIVG